MRLKLVHFNFTDLKVNRIIRYFIAVDLLLWGGWGFAVPIFALFVVGNITGASAITVGIESAIYWITKSLLQVPVALFLDRQSGDRIDFHMLIAGLMLAGFVALIFPIISSVWALYFLALLQGVGFALYTPSWSAVFSRHLDKNHYAFDWALDSTSIGIASGVAALIGGTIATVFGFNTVFILTGFFSLASAALLLAVPDLVLPRATVAVQPILPDHAPGAPKE